MRGLGAVYTKKEDLKKRNNFTLGLHAEILVRVVKSSLPASSPGRYWRRTG